VCVCVCVCPFVYPHMRHVIALSCFPYHDRTQKDPVNRQSFSMRLRNFNPRLPHTTCHVDKLSGQEESKCELTSGWNLRCPRSYFLCGLSILLQDCTYFVMLRWWRAKSKYWKFKTKTYLHWQYCNAWANAIVHRNRICKVVWKESKAHWRKALTLCLAHASLTWSVSSERGSPPSSRLNAHSSNRQTAGSCKHQKEMLNCGQLCSSSKNLL